MAKVSLRAYNREIEAMIDRNHLDEAVAHCQHILKTFPKHLETYRLLGKAYLEARRHNEAVDIFTRVLAAEPNDFVAHVGMSIVRDEQTKLDDAIWHMERAFEVQSANPAIQAELQRLYGRRDGIQPPRIRMTRGALAHMYVRGELYPQAISETKGVLEEDQGRSDMQVLLAKAYYRSGLKKDAADAASVVLKRYPFCLDANLVLAEILGTDRPESAQGYRQRVVELDPYAAQADNMFLAAEVSDAAVSLERLDWNGQPVGMTEDWRSTNAISLESGISDREAQPEWMKASYPEETPLSAPAFDSDQDASSQPALPADDIPDFLKAAGWGAATGAFDESKSSAMFDDESAPAVEPIAQGDLPDWVKAMAPAEASQPAEEQAEEIPDWINKIGTSDLPVPSVESEETDWDSGLGEPAATLPAEGQPDWLKSLEEDQPSPVPPAADDLDWLKSLEQGEQPAPVTSEQPDWLRGLGEEGQPVQPAAEDLDWVKGLEQDEQPASVAEERSAPAASDDLDWLKALEQDEQPASAAEEQPTWLKDLGEEQPAPAPVADDLDWLKSLEQDEQPVPAADEQPAWMKGFAEEGQHAPAAEETAPADADNLDWLKGLEQDEQPAPVTDEQPAWMRGLEQEEQPVSAPESQPDWMKGFGEEEQPSAAIEDQPDWLKGFGQEEQPISASEDQPDWLKDLGADEPVTAQPAADFDFLDELKDEQVVPEPSPISSIKIDTGSLGTSEKEQDDSFAWLEALAAKQGATEGLLTTPEERLEEEPDWVKQAKGLNAPVVEEPVEELPAPVPLVDAGRFDQIEAEPEDSFAWLETSAAEESPTEGLSAEPEAHLEQPEAVEDTQPTRVQRPPVVEEPVPAPEPLSTPTASVEEPGEIETERDDSFARLESIAPKRGETEDSLTKPEEQLDNEPEWLKRLKRAGNARKPVPAQQKPFEEEIIPEPVSQLEVQLPVEEATPVETEPVSELEVQSLVEEVVPVEPEPVSELEVQPLVEELTPAEPEPVYQFEQQMPVEEEALAEPEFVSPAEQQVPVEEETLVEPEPVSAPTASIEELGRSEAEQDDSFAWLEALAAKQGATEGLLTKPEERLEQEPDWVKQVKKTTGELRPIPEQQPPVEEEVFTEPEPVSQMEAQPPVEEEAVVEPEPVSAPTASIEELGRSEAEQDDSFAWLEALAAKQGATEGLLTKPEERLEEEPEWVRQAKELKEEVAAPPMETPVEPEPAADLSDVEESVPLWHRGLDEVDAEPAPAAADDTVAWLKSLDEPEEEPIALESSADDLPAWLQDISGEEAPAAESAVPTEEAEVSEWKSVVEEPGAESAALEQESATEELPDWLHSIEEEQPPVVFPVSDDLPAWMRDATGEVVAEPTKIEPTRSSDWAPLDEEKVKAVEPPPSAPQPAPEPKAAPAPKAKKPAKKETVKPATPPEPYREPITTIRGTGMLTMPVDPILGSARNELSRSNIPGALEAYGKLIKKGRFLEEVIFDLREALYRYPVEVSIWQALGDAYMRANRLQDALDAYTKAEELLR